MQKIDFLSRVEEVINCKLTMPTKQNKKIKEINWFPLLFGLGPMDCGQVVQAVLHGPGPNIVTSQIWTTISQNWTTISQNWTTISQNWTTISQIWTTISQNWTCEMRVVGG
jgi:hypothetical protein